MQKGFGVWVALLSVLMGACNPADTCLTPQTVALRVGFSTAGADTVLPNANLGLEKGGFWYVIPLKGQSGFALPLPQVQDSIRLLIQPDSSLQSPEALDTIDLHYTRELHFISTACGYETFFTLTGLSFTRNTLDTVELLQPKVNNDVNSEHVRLVFFN